MAKNLRSKKRILFSKTANNTKKMLWYVLVSIIILIGFSHLFLSNQVAFRVFLLQKETEIQKDFSDKIRQIESKIANLETREFLKNKDVVKDMDSLKNVFLDITKV